MTPSPTTRPATNNDVGPVRSYLRDGRAPLPAHEVTSRVMSANKGRDTGPELVLRNALAHIGVRGYRLHRKGVLGRPDLSFGPARLAVFVNGCFWHRCPHCRLPLPKTHTLWWRAKFERNVGRDREKADLLHQQGWRVLTLWECEIEQDIVRCAGRIVRLLEETTPRPKRSVLAPGR